MNPNYRTDAERSVLRPAEPYLIDRSFDSVAQRHYVVRPTFERLISAASTIVLPATRHRLQPSPR
jgi:hypothetical protein